MATKYSLFQNNIEESYFWDNIFESQFPNYLSYQIANKYEDDILGIDVWLKTGEIKRIGVQLKTSRDRWVNVHYEMHCKSGWHKLLGINTYVKSPQLDYMVYAYPEYYDSYMIKQTDLMTFWEVYADQLCDYALKEYPDNYGGDCWKYYFQIGIDQFELMFDAIDVKLSLVQAFPF